MPTRSASALFGVLASRASSRTMWRSTSSRSPPSVRTGFGEPVATLARLYGSRYVLRGPTTDDVGVLLGAGVVLGWIGAWIVAARHLRDIEPRA